MSFAYFSYFPSSSFMASMAPEGVAWMTDIDKYLSSCSPPSSLRRDLRGAGGGYRAGARRRRVGEKLKEIRPYVIVGAS